MKYVVSFDTAGDDGACDKFYESLTDLGETVRHPKNNEKMPRSTFTIDNPTSELWTVQALKAEILKRAELSGARIQKILIVKYDNSRTVMGM